MKSKISWSKYADTQLAATTTAAIISPSVKSYIFCLMLRLSRILAILHFLSEFILRALMTEGRTAASSFRPVRSWIDMPVAHGASRCVVRSLLPDHNLDIDLMDLDFTPDRRGSNSQHPRSTHLVPISVAETSHNHEFLNRI
jgi:hypothetical protein